MSAPKSPEFYTQEQNLRVRAVELAIDHYRTSPGTSAEKIIEFATSVVTFVRQTSLEAAR